MRADSADERWEGFWSVADDNYYTRCVRPDGSEEWFTFVDGDAPARAIEAALQITHATDELTTADSSRMLLLSTRGSGRRPILVGTLRRGARSRVRAEGRR